ncbi:hypothetical protein [Kineococcus sp. SYSU DK004]|uniref:hypothetical protein n=1 Tax=Kineococcus sp. SYSU DK004 TaxID=3383125 RepID=UPI003D7C3737
MVAFDAHGNGDSMSALVGGALAYDGSCLSLDALPVLWPVGTTWDERTSSVVLPDGTSAPAGTVLSAGGGVVPFTDDAWPADPDAATALEECLDPSRRIVSFNTGAQPSSPASAPT